MSLRHVPYHVLLYSPDGSRGPGAALAELDPWVLNLAWSQTLNMSGQAVFTLSRKAPVLDLIAPMRTHVKVFRQDSGGTVRTVFAGRVSKADRGNSDAVVSCVDYAGFLARSRTAYDLKYAQKLIGTEVVAPEWSSARGVADSPLAFVATGTIEDPLGDDGLTAMKTNAEFGVSLFDRLFTFYNLAELSMANTDNSVVWEVTREAPHTFNFWRNRSANRTAASFVSPGTLASLSFDGGDEQVANDLATPLANPDGGAGSAYQLEDATSIATYGRLQAAVSLDTLIGITSTADNKVDQSKAALARLLKERLRPAKLVAAMPTSPLDVFNGWDLADNLRTTIAKSDRATDFHDAYLRVSTVAAVVQADHGEQSVVYLRSHP